jgi:chromosome partitioning protein
MIDLDQQANLTRACRIDTNKIVTMIDVITNSIALEDHMVPVADGLDLFPSKFENAMLSTTLLINTFPLDKVFKDLVDPLRKNYDLIFIDCPPDLDATVTAAVLAADFVLAPVEPDEFSVGGFHLTNMELKKIEKKFGKKIPLRIVMNKYDNRTFLSHKTLAELMNDKETGALLFKSFIRNCQDFSNILIKNESLFDSMRASPAKEDIDLLTKEIIEYCQKTE